MTNPTPPRTVVRRAALAAAGGAIGTAARLGVGMLVPGALAHGAAAGVLVANVIGSLLLGVLVARLPSSDLRIFVGTGMLGGFTTYSAFAVDTVALWETAPALAVGYVVVSIALGLAAAALGLRLGRRPVRGSAA